MRPFAEACERNRGPILGVLRRIFHDRNTVLEIGSGTGQHAAYFAPELPHLVWQPSDVAEHLPGIRMWVDSAATRNLRTPVVLEVENELHWKAVSADAAFSANTTHIMSWTQVERMFEGVARLLPAGGLLALYGPFNYGGRHTSESNARFDAMLRSRDPASGLRDFEAIAALATKNGLALVEDNAMPANNRLLAFRRSGSEPDLKSGSEPEPDSP